MFSKTRNAVILDDLPKLDIRELRDLFYWGLLPLPLACYKDSVYVGGRKYDVELIAKDDVDPEHARNRKIIDPADYGSLYLEWRDDIGKIRGQGIDLYEVRNKSKRSYFYFVCPETGVRCRVLYANKDGLLSSRQAIEGAHYRSEYKKAHPKSDPHRKNGKTHYRGNLTPYGKRVKKYEAQLNTTTKMKGKKK